jgi:hypothetical protein
MITLKASEQGQTFGTTLVFMMHIFFAVKFKKAANPSQHSCFSLSIPAGSIPGIFRPSFPGTASIIAGKSLNGPSYQVQKMNFDLKQMLESKKALRRKLASRPVAEKLAMLDALRERAVALLEAGDHMRDSAVNEAPEKYRTGQNKGKRPKR